MAEHELHKRMMDAGDCLPQEELLAYHAGTLSPADRHRVERHLLDCEWCAEALEGLEGVSPAEVQAATTDITERAWKRIAENKRRGGAWIWMVSSAAVVLIAVGLFFMNRSEYEPASQKAFTEAFDPNPLPAPAPEPGENDSLVAMERNTPAEVEKAEFRDNAPVGTGQKISEYTQGFTGPEYKPDPNTSYRSEATENKTQTTTLFDGLFEDERLAVADQSMDDMEGEKEEAQKATAPNTGNTSTIGQNRWVDIADNDLATEETVVADSVSLSGNIQKSGSYYYSNSQPANSGKVSPSSPYLNNNRSQNLADNSEGRTRSNAPSLKSKVDVKAPVKDIPATTARDEKRELVQSQDVEMDKNTELFNSTSGAVAGIPFLSTVTTVCPEAMQLHNAGKYTEALPKFRTCVEENPGDHESKLYAGIDAIAANQPGEALGWLNTVIEKGDARQREDATWYKAMALLKANDSLNAIALLNQIVAGNGRYTAKAQEALNKLK